jgi:hypothetical protein
MQRTQVRRTRQIVKGVEYDVRLGAEIIQLDKGVERSENVTLTYRRPRSWVDRLVGLFDNSPLNAEVLQYEKEARERMDAEFVMPE